jgi:hypothetical protein
MGERRGAEPCGPQAAPPLVIPVQDPIPLPENAADEVGALHIALENLVISLLATASDRQLEQAREMASYISPRPGFTHHPLTTRARRT